MRYICLLIVAAAFMSGCAAKMAVVSNTKTAYAVRAGFLSADMYYCDATSGRPVCREVSEE